MTSGGLRRLLAPANTPLSLAQPPVGQAVSPEWLVADGWRAYARVGAETRSAVELFARFDRSDGTSVEAGRDSTGGIVLPFDLEEAYDNFVLESWRDAVEQHALSARQLNFFYQVKRFIPRSLQLAARRALTRRQARAPFPVWPYEPGVERLLKLYAACLLASDDADELQFRWFWPDGCRAATILTHDVESAEGLRLAVELADLEEERGFRSSFNVVGDWYDIDEGILRELRSRGFEIGVHGMHHDRSLFRSREDFEQQLPALAATRSRFEADGFRSPATHRVDGWLCELPFAYDCTMPLSDPYEPQPGGCASPWPFFLGPVVELPYTLPQDHTLFTVLRHASIDLWLNQLDRLTAAGGLIQSVSHPDPGYLADPPKRKLFAEFLVALSEREGLWHALPRDVAAWWRARDRGDDDRIVAGTARLADGRVELAVS